MSDNTQVAVADDRSEHDFFSNTIKFTKICTTRCGALNGKDDALTSKEESCLKNCIRNALSTRQFFDRRPGANSEDD